MTSAGLQDVGHAVVANRTAKSSICRISAIFAEIKALSFKDVAHLDCLPLFVQRAFEHPLNRKIKTGIHLASFRGGSLLLNEDKITDSAAVMNLFLIPHLRKPLKDHIIIPHARVPKKYNVLESPSMSFIRNERKRFISHFIIIDVL